MKEKKAVHGLYPYQFRVLNCLIRKPYFIAHLNKAAKQQHSPMAVKELREMGLDIDSVYKANPDHAVTRRKVVEYQLHPDSREEAHRMLTAHKGSSKKVDNNQDNSKGSKL